MVISHGGVMHFLTFIDDFLGQHFFIPWKLNLVCLTSLKYSKLW
jgi:broad specificity phosphatase PhoE